jgi:hypothetical protein
MEYVIETFCSSITRNEINSLLKAGFAIFVPLQINQSMARVAKEITHHRLLLPFGFMPYLSRKTGSVSTFG